jgi:sugar lactone lactonase YvrE
MVANREFDSVMFKPGIIDFAAGSTWAVYASLSISVSGQSSYPYGVAFSSDGTKMYVQDYTSGLIYQYTLSTAWNISTATYTTLSANTYGQAGHLGRGITFSADGTKMYTVNYGNGTVYQYTLSTAWNSSTASYASLSVSVLSQSTAAAGVIFSSDGTKMYILDNANVVYQYTLSTAWNVSTASYASKSISVSSQSPAARAIYFSSDGTKMYVVDSTNKAVYEYTLSTAWNISTATYASKSASISSQAAVAYGLAFSVDGTKMYIVDNSSQTVYQYTMH